MTACSTLLAHARAQHPVGVLKITPEDFESLRQLVAPHDTPERRAQYRDGAFPRAELCRDVNMRYRWDLLWSTGLKIGDGVGAVSELTLYSYLDDTHIDSALRAIVPPL